MPDSIGRDDSEVNASSSPLVRGSVKQSRRGQDSQACDDSSISFGMGGSAHKVGRFSAGNQEEALEMKEGSRKVLNLSYPVSSPGVNDRLCLADALDGILDGNIRRKLHAYMRAHKPPNGDTPIKIADQALEPHGLYLKRVFAKFEEEPGGFVYNALQLRRARPNSSRWERSSTSFYWVEWDSSFGPPSQSHH